MGNNFGIIDIGSNSVRLLLDIGGKRSKEVIITRLAENSVNGTLNPVSIERTANAVLIFYNKAKSLGAKVYAFGTAALRNAKNSEDFLSRVEKDTGLKVDVVSGDKEATLSLSGALGGLDGGVIDIGGASTEITVRKRGEIIYKKSVNIGAVVLSDDFFGHEDGLNSFVIQKIKEFGCVPNSFFTAVGGTATSCVSVLLEMEKYNPEIVDGFVLNKSELVFTQEKLFLTPLEERQKLKGLQKERAKVLPFGLKILSSLYDYLGIDKLSVSEKDNLEGYLYYLKGENL